MDKAESGFDSEPLLPSPLSTSRRSSTYRIARDKVVKDGLSILILAFLIYNAVVVTISILEKPVNTPLIYSPANAALQYEVKDAWDRGDSSPWLQGTLEETDKLWDKLMSGLDVRISEEEMLKTQPGFASTDDNLQLSDGNYVGVLGVYHALHCLDVFRLALNQDAYDISEAQRAEALNLHHYYHCIDFLRDDIMCHADLTIYRAVWTESSGEMDTAQVRSGSQRQCVRWDPIAAWANERALSESDLVRPGPYENPVSEE